MLSYNQNLRDSLGCVHSIDNVVVEYLVKSFRREFVLDELSVIFSETVPGWERSKCCKDELPACSKYQYFRSAIWGGGFSIQYGHYQDFDKVTREWSEYPVLRVKFNPNKWLDTPVFRRLLPWLDDMCDNGVLVKFDYAIDVPCRLKDVSVHSRKERGIYRGTLYYGQRNKHGRLKVYDKRAESCLPDDVTRVEWTFCLGKPIVFDSVFWLTSGPAPLPDARELGKSYALVRLLLDIRALGGDVVAALGYLDGRTAKKIEPYTVGSGVQLVSGIDYLVSLLSYYCDTLNVSFSADGVNAISIGAPVSRHSMDDLEADELPF